MPFAAARRLERADALSLRQRSVLTVEAVRWFFGVKKGAGEADALRTNMTSDRVVEFYRYIADLWPQRLPVLDLLRKVRSPEAYEAFYVGWVRPETILRAVTRVALYTEQILVPQPFHLPWMIRDEYDPIRHPGKSRMDTHRWATVMLLVEPWIKAGLITLVPEPEDYDPDLRDAMFAAGARREREGKAKIHPDDFRNIEQIAREEHRRGFLSLPDDTLIELIRESEDVPDEKVPSVLKYLHGERDADPFSLQDILPDEGYLQRLSIPTIETTTYSCGLTGAFPFTDMRGKWEELLDAVGDLPADAEVWTPLSAAFSRLTFNFLDGYDARFAFEVREDGRLAAFRGFLRDIWKKIDGSPSVDDAQRYARDFQDRLQTEYTAASAEWSTIHLKYGANRKKDALTYGFGGASAASLADTFSHGVLGIAFSLGLYLFRAKKDAETLSSERANFRAKFPLSIFIDVRDKSPSNVV